MNWLVRHRIQLYVRNSIWIYPSFAIVAGLIAVSLLSRFERFLGWHSNLDPETARTVMATVASSLLTLVVLVTSAMLLVVQLASAQLTPRIIAFVYRNNTRKLLLSLFVFTFTFSVGVLVRIEDSVPLLSGYFAAYGFLLNLALMLYFIDGVGKTLRPSSVLRVVGLSGREVIAAVYPRRLDEQQALSPEPIAALDGKPDRIIVNLVGGSVLAFDLKGLVSLAEQSDCLIELIPQVGDFVAAGDPLFQIFEGGGDLSDEVLRKSVALGQERTLEQDPMFAFRVIVDIASKALSPAINDPTTAVLAIDQIHHLLREVGNRYLAEGRERDRAGRARLVYRTPNWENFLHLAVTEIRHYGRDSIQVMRRLRAMLENLIETLPARRTPLLRRELELLHQSSKRAFPDMDDQVLADIGDLQGMGGV
ncbi:MAG TPA: DUF2254 domain-containing protein, partial [Pyrinomonadaceae bacterium]|nr:DUF2254 domain-containing protein [Pyrinomonadaceae bacterium]